MTAISHNDIIKQCAVSFQLVQSVEAIECLKKLVKSATFTFIILTPSPTLHCKVISELSLSLNGLSLTTGGVSFKSIVIGCLQLSALQHHTHKLPFIVERQPLHGRQLIQLKHTL